MRDTREILEDIIKNISYLEQFIADGEEVFRQDVKTQFAVRHAYEVIGDMVKQLPDNLLETQSQISWRAIKGMRDVIAHQYFQLSLDRIWDATQQIEPLKAAIIALLATLSSDAESTNADG